MSSSQPGPQLAITARPTKVSCGLLTIPPELRLQIYGHCFEDRFYHISWNATTLTPVYSALRLVCKLVQATKNTVEVLMARERNLIGTGSLADADAIQSASPQSRDVKVQRLTCNSCARRERHRGKFDGEECCTYMGEVIRWLESQD